MPAVLSNSSTKPMQYLGAEARLRSRTRYHGERGLPEEVCDLGVSDVAVCAGWPAPVPDYGAGIDVVDLPAIESVLGIRIEY